MCLAIPAKILAINAEQALVDYDGLELDVDVSLVPQAQVGDFVVVHVGIALSLMTSAEALEVLKTHREFEEFGKVGQSGRLK
ncbi:MAG: HypC/HybG/HupF family hydrogenase formation chaperone [Pseudobdellovibrionaceae bacterium]